MMLLSSLLCLALVRRQPVLAALIALPIILTKPQWLFPFILPLVQRRFGVLIKSLAALLGFYVVANGLYLLVGTSYGWDSLIRYQAFLRGLSANYPWAGTEVMFLTTQNSLYQTWLRYFGFQSWIGIATLISQGIIVLLTIYGIITAYRSRRGLLFVLFMGAIAAALLLPEFEEGAFGALILVFIYCSGNRLARWLSGLYVLYLINDLISLGIKTLHLPIPRPVQLAFPMLLISYLALLVACLVIVRSQQPQTQLAENVAPSALSRSLPV